MRRHVCPLGVIGGRRAAGHCHVEDFGQVQRLAIRGLRDLLVAAESVGHDQRVLRDGPDGGQKDSLARLHGDVVVTRLKTERPRHPAAARLGNVDIQSDPAQYLQFVVHLHQRLVVAMAVDKRAPSQLSEVGVGSVALG